MDKYENKTNIFESGCEFIIYEEKINVWIKIDPHERSRPANDSIVKLSGFIQGYSKLVDQSRLGDNLLQGPHETTGNMILFCPSITCHLFRLQVRRQINCPVSIGADRSGLGRLFSTPEYFLAPSNYSIGFFL